MKFIFFSAQYLPTIGGVERYTFSLAKALLKKGHSAVVVTSALNGLPNEEIDENGIKIYRMPVFSLMGGRFPVLKTNRLFRCLKEKIKGENADFCVIQTRFYTNSIFGAYFAYKNRLPSIVVEHGTAHLMRGGITGFLGNIYEHLTIKIINRYCKSFYGVSHACCEWLRHFHIKTHKVLYNAVDIFELDSLANNANNLDFLPNNLNKNVKLIAFAGRFIPEKGVIQLANAFKKLQQKHSNTMLVMAGDGELWQKINENKSNNIILPQSIEYSKCLALFKRSDIFCLPTFSEGFASAVLEAAALDAAIITTPTGGSPELIVDKSHGLLIEDMSEESIYNALCYAVENEEWCSLAAHNARIKLAESFTWDKVSDMLIKIAEDEKAQ